MFKLKNKKKKDKDTKMSPGIKKTLFAILLVIAFMGIVFSFQISLVWKHETSKEIKANIFLWPLMQFNELLVYKWIGIPSSNTWAKILMFFITEAPYILFIMLFFSYLFNVARSFSTEAEISQWMEKQEGIKGRIVGVLSGVISPFCSCSTIPIVTSMLKSGIPFGTLSAFLITSPMINEMGIVLMLSLWGYKITFIYIAFGILIGFVGSYVFTSLKLEKQIKIKRNIISEQSTLLSINVTLKYMHKKGAKASMDNLKKFWWILLLAMAVGALMHGWIPSEWIQKNIGNKWWGPLAIVPIGALMYLNVTATIPIVNGFITKGLGLGTSLGFLMGVNTLSFPEMMILSKMFKKKFMITFIVYLVSAILIFAYILFFIQLGAGIDALLIK